MDVLKSPCKGGGGRRLSYPKMMIMRKYLIFAVNLIFLLPYASSINNDNDVEKRAFVTVITTENYVDAAMVMGSTLRAFTNTIETVDDRKVQVDYICLALLRNNDNFSENLIKRGVGVSPRGARRLEMAGWEVKGIPYIIWNPDHEDSMEDYTDESYAWNYNKLWIWSLTGYDKIVYLDSDLLVIQNINELFDIEIWDGSTSSQFAAAPNMIPSDKFNSGVMVIRPDQSIFVEMMNALKTGFMSSYDKGDQGFLNEFFPDWYGSSSAHRLSPKYNAPYAWTGEEAVWLAYRSEIKVLHFYGGGHGTSAKPWHILSDPTNHKVSKYAAPIIYAWSILMFFVTQPSGNLEDEARYLLENVFDVTKSSAKLKNYIDRLKKGGTRKRLSVHGGNHFKSEL